MFYYYDSNGVRVGPYALLQLRRLASLGLIVEETIIEAPPNQRKFLAREMQELEFSNNFNSEPPRGAEMQIELNGVMTTVTKEQLEALVKKGRVQPDTTIFVGGKRFPASAIRGIGFRPAVPPPIPASQIPRTNEKHLEFEQFLTSKNKIILGVGSALVALALFIILVVAVDRFMPPEDYFDDLGPQVVDSIKRDYFWRSDRRAAASRAREAIRRSKAIYNAKLEEKMREIKEESRKRQKAMDYWRYGR
ncbi:MAG: DUF4339 domain-containing protein [Planctomycetaceae bacterium]|jgi:hypothetical protein|nr:DUF4339 domain-containing protein [Planctomycetaceae bacterium]